MIRHVKDSLLQQLKVRLPLKISMDWIKEAGGEPMQNNASIQTSEAGPEGYHGERLQKPLRDPGGPGWLCFHHLPI